jgi:hypothetical protein
MNDDASIREIREKLSAHNLSLHLSAAAAVGMVAAEDKWTAIISPEKPLVSPRFEATGSTDGEAANRAYDKFLELMTTEKTSRPKDVSEVDTSNDPDV